MMQAPACAGATRPQPRPGVARRQLQHTKRPPVERDDRTGVDAEKERAGVVIVSSA